MVLAALTMISVDIFMTERGGAGRVGSFEKLRKRGRCLRKKRGLFLRRRGGRDFTGAQLALHAFDAESRQR